MGQTLTGKLNLKPEHKGLLLNVPPRVAKYFEHADVKPRVRVAYDFVILFVNDSAELNAWWPKVPQLVKEAAMIWIFYPKKNSSTPANISRDYGWGVVCDSGFEPVSQIALDETWSGLRFKRARSNSAAATETKPETFFTAVIESPPDVKGGYVSIPFDVEKAFGKKGHVKVKASFDGYPYRGIIANMGTGCHIIIVRKDIQQAIGKRPGDKVKVTLEPDTEERVLEMPPELHAALMKNPKAKKFFDSLSYTNRKEYAQWINTAKKSETREKRLNDTIQKLLSGLKNPTQK